MPLKKNILSHAFATAIGSGIQFILIIFLANHLSKEMFGHFILIVALVSILDIASDFGMRIGIIKKNIENKSEEDLFLRVVLSKLILSLFIFSFLLVVSFNGFSPLQLLLITLIAGTQPSTDPLLWWLRSIERIDIESLFVIFWRVLNFLLFVILLSSSDEFSILLVAWVLSNVIRIVLEKIIIKVIIPTSRDYIYFRKDAFSLKPIVMLLRNTIPLGVSLIVMAIYIRLNTFIINNIGQPVDVAIYGAAFTIAVSSGFLATSITVSIFPRLVSALKDDNKDEVIHLSHKMINNISILFFVIGLTGIIFSKNIIMITYGNDYKESIYVMILLLPGLYISSLNFSLKYILNAFNLIKQELQSVILGMIALLLLFYMFSFGCSIIISASLSWSISEMLVFSYKSYLLTSKKSMYFNANFFYKKIFLFVVLFLAGIWYLARL